MLLELDFLHLHTLIYNVHHKVQINKEKAVKKVKKGATVSFRLSENLVGRFGRFRLIGHRRLFPEIASHTIKSFSKTAIFLKIGGKFFDLAVQQKGLLMDQTDHDISGNFGFNVRFVRIVRNVRDQKCHELPQLLKVLRAAPAHQQFPGRGAVPFRKVTLAQKCLIIKKQLLLTCLGDIGQFQFSFLLVALASEPSTILATPERAAWTI